MKRQKRTHTYSRKWNCRVHAVSSDPSDEPPWTAASAPISPENPLPNPRVLLEIHRGCEKKEKSNQNAPNDITSIDWLNNVNKSVSWLIDWVELTTTVSWLIDWVELTTTISWLIDWLIDWLIYLNSHCVFASHFHARMRIRILSGFNRKSSNNRIMPFTRMYSLLRSRSDSLYFWKSCSTFLRSGCVFGSATRKRLGWLKYWSTARSNFHAYWERQFWAVASPVSVKLVNLDEEAKK